MGTAVSEGSEESSQPSIATVSAALRGEEHSEGLNLVRISEAVPGFLELELRVPAATRVYGEDLALDVSRDSVRIISTPTSLPLEVTLPFPVNPDSARARLSRSRRRLLVRLRRAT